MIVTKKDFIETFENGMNEPDLNFMMVCVKGVGSAPEMIINTKENFKTKYDYYRENYGNEMELIHNPKIQITYIGFFETLLDLLMELVEDPDGVENA